MRRDDYIFFFRVFRALSMATDRIAGSTGFLLLFLFVNISRIRPALEIPRLTRDDWPQQIQRVHPDICTQFIDGNFSAYERIQTRYA